MRGSELVLHLYFKSISLERVAGAVVMSMQSQVICLNIADDKEAVRYTAFTKITKQKPRRKRYKINETPRIGLLPVLSVTYVVRLFSKTSRIAAKVNSLVSFSMCFVVLVDDSGELIELIKYACPRVAFRTLSLPFLRVKNTLIPLRFPPTIVPPPIGLSVMAY